MLMELGFKPRPELTVTIDSNWEPTPDVCGIVGRDESPYPTEPVAVAMEILSPADPFTRVVKNAAGTRSGESPTSSYSILWTVQRGSVTHRR